MLQGVQNSSTYQSFGSFYRYRLYTERRSLRETYFLHSHLVAQKSIELFSFRSPLFPFYTGINIFCIFAENMHVYFLRFLYRRNHSTEPAYRTQTNIQIECLAQCHIQRTDAFAYRSSKRSLYTDKVFAKSIHCSFRKPFSGLLECLFSSQYFFPLDRTRIIISQFNSLVYYFLTYRSNFCSHSITFNIRNGHTVGYYQPTVFHIYFGHNF